MGRPCYRCRDLFTILAILPIFVAVMVQMKLLPNPVVLYEAHDAQCLAQATALEEQASAETTEWLKAGQPNEGLELIMVRWQLAVDSRVAPCSWVYAGWGKDIANLGTSLKKAAVIAFYRSLLLQQNPEMALSSLMYAKSLMASSKSMLRYSKDVEDRPDIGEDKKLLMSLWRNFDRQFQQQRTHAVYTPGSVEPVISNIIPEVSLSSPTAQQDIVKAALGSGVVMAKGVLGDKECMDLEWYLREQEQFEASSWSATDALDYINNSTYRIHRRYHPTENGWVANIVGEGISKVAPALTELVGIDAEVVDFASITTSPGSPDQQLTRVQMPDLKDIAPMYSVYFFLQDNADMQVYPNTHLATKLPTDKLGYMKQKTDGPSPVKASCGDLLIVDATSLRRDTAHVGEDQKDMVYLSVLGRIGGIPKGASWSLLPELLGRFHLGDITTNTWAGWLKAEL